MEARVYICLANAGGVSTLWVREGMERHAHTNTKTMSTRTVEYIHTHTRARTPGLNADDCAPLDRVRLCATACACARARVCVWREKTLVVGVDTYFSKLSIQPKLDETLVNQYYYLDSDTFLKHIKKNFKYIIKQVNKPENKELIDKITTTTQSGRWWETPNNISTLPIGGRMSKKSKSFYSLSSNKSKKNTHNYNLQGGSNILPYLAIILSGFKQTHFILNKDKLEYQVRDDEINLYTKTKINDIHIPISPSNISIVDIYSKKLEEIINNDISLNIVQLLSNKENNIIKGGLVNEVCSNIETCEYVKLFQTLYQKIKIARGKKKVYDEIVSKLINGDMTTPLPNITIDNAEKLFCMLNISINEKINCSNLSGGNKTKKKRKTKKKNKSYMD